MANTWRRIGDGRGSVRSWTNDNGCMVFANRYRIGDRGNRSYVWYYNAVRYNADGTHTTLTRPRGEGFTTEDFNTLAAAQAAFNA